MRSLTASEMRTFRRSLQTVAGELDQTRAEYLHELLIANVLVDDEGNLLFTQDDAVNGVFDELDGAVLSRTFQLAKEWTGFALDDDFSALEQAVKNSENGQANVTPVG